MYIDRSLLFEAKVITLYNNELISLLTTENDELWYSKRGLPWCGRENANFLSKRNLSYSDGTEITAEAACTILEKWIHHWR